jgi:hypothetical protein
LAVLCLYIPILTPHLYVDQSYMFLLNTAIIQKTTWRHNRENLL